MAVEWMIVNECNSSIYGIGFRVSGLRNFPVSSQASRTFLGGEAESRSVLPYHLPPKLRIRRRPTWSMPGFWSENSWRWL